MISGQVFSIVGLLTDAVLPVRLPTQQLTKRSKHPDVSEIYHTMADMTNRPARGLLI